MLRTTATRIVRWRATTAASTATTCIRNNNRSCSSVITPQLRLLSNEKDAISIDAARLDVYPPGTPLDALDDNARLRPRGPVPGGTTDEQPLMVVAPQLGESNYSHTRRMADEIFVKRHVLADHKRPKRTLSYVTKSHTFSDLIKEGRVQFGTDFFFPLVASVPTSAFETNGPKSTDDENRVHHQYFLRETKKLVASALEAGLTIRQQILWTSPGQWLKLDNGSPGVDPDFSTVDFVGDLPLVAEADNERAQPPSKYDAVMVLEQNNAFKDQDQFDAIDYGERLLCIQRGRSVAYSALFHCCREEKIIRWVRTKEVNGEFRTAISRPASLNPGGEGQRQLLTMLSKSSGDLGLPFHKFRKLESGETPLICCCIGEGATSTVYLGTLGQKEGAFKVMKSGFEPLADHEKQIIDHLERAGVPGLQQCIKVENGVLFFDRLLQEIEGSFSVSQVADMLNCLEKFHAAGVVHRDIRPENIMKDAQGRVYIIDWGFAWIQRQDAQPPPFEGTFRYASKNVLHAVLLNQPWHPKPADDLESLVKTVVAVNSGQHRIWHTLSAITQGDFMAARRVWSQECHQFPLLQTMLEAAANCDYLGLRRYFY